MRSLVAGIIFGVIIAEIWKALNRPKPTSPDKNDNVIDINTPLESEKVG